MCLQYATALADRFSSLEEFFEADEKELIDLGLSDSVKRSSLIEQARLLDDKVRKSQTNKMKCIVD